MRPIFVVALAVSGCQAWPHGGQDPDDAGQVPDAGAVDSGAFAGAAAGVGTFLPVVVVTPSGADAGAGR